MAEHDPGGKVKLSIPDWWVRGARFSPCNKYRYSLMRAWDSNGPKVLFILMNPSTGDLDFSDPTIAKCCRFAQKWGFGGVYIANTCAYRATDKRRLLEVEDPVGPDNRQHILGMAKVAKLIVVAHGKLPGKLQRHADETVQMLREAAYELHVFRLGVDGTPAHPLYLKESIKPVLWNASKEKVNV